MATSAESSFSGLWGKFTRFMQNFKASPSCTHSLTWVFPSPTATSVGFYVSIIVLLSWSWLTSIHSSLRSPGLKPRVFALSTVNNGNYLTNLKKFFS